MEYGIEDWEGLSDAFRDMFDGLGKVEADESRLEFTSFPSDVATGISLSRDGSMLANMPLHGIDSVREGPDRREEGVDPAVRARHGLHLQGPPCDTQEEGEAQRTE